MGAKIMARNRPSNEGAFSHARVLDQALGDSSEEGHSDFGVGYLPTTEADRHPDFGTLAEEALHLTDLGFQIVVADTALEPDFPQLVGCLASLCLSSLPRPCAWPRT